MLPVRYVLDFSQAKNHLIHVVAHLPAEEVDNPARAREVTLPTWTPGSYLIREYARHLEGLCAVDGAGNSLALAKVAKDRWRIDVPADKEVWLRYRVYARELSVRTSHVEEDFALVHPAATFLGLVGNTRRKHEVTLCLPKIWSEGLCALDEQTSTLDLEKLGVFAEGSVKTYVADDYDTLIDSPCLLGNPRLKTFLVDGVTHTLALLDPLERIDVDALAQSTHKIVEENRTLWEKLPYSRYIFMHLALGGYGGLEHKNCAVTISDPFALDSGAGHDQLMGLLAHEHFHAWNIKRLRPRVLGPFDYSREALTTSLWVAEGLTAYYDDLQVCRAQLATPKSYLAALSKTYSQIEGAYGRHVQTLGSASLDAWIKFYRPDENSANTQVSYYAKGALLGFVLDAHLREITSEEKSLDDVMRVAFSRYSHDKGYTEMQFREVVDEVAGQSCQRFLAERIDTTLSWDYSHAWNYFGLVVEPEPQSDDAPQAYLGAHLNFEEGRLMVKQVRRDGPAYHGGLNVGDELVALGKVRILRQSWSALQQTLRADTTAKFVVCRHNRLIDLCVVPAPRSALQYKIAIDPSASSRAHERREHWLNPRRKAAQ